MFRSFRAVKIHHPERAVTCNFIRSRLVKGNSNLFSNSIFRVRNSRLATIKMNNSRWNASPDWSSNNEKPRKNQIRKGKRLLWFRSEEEFDLSRNVMQSAYEMCNNKTFSFGRLPCNASVRNRSCYFIQMQKCFSCNLESRKMPERTRKLAYQREPNVIYVFFFCKIIFCVRKCIKSEIIALRVVTICCCSTSGEVHMPYWTSCGRVKYSRHVCRIQNMV